MEFAIGDVAVSVVTDFERVELPIARFLPDADRDVLAAARDFLEPEHAVLDRDTLSLAIQSFVLRVAGRTILIDPCVGEHKPRPTQPDWNLRSATGYLSRLSTAGVRPDEVDVVFCTHLHSDHVGWNTQLVDGRWVPTFPSARYLIGRSEMAHWQALLAQAAAPYPALQDSVLPVVQAGQVDLIDDGYEPAAGISLIPLPGHTPGQMGLHLHRGGERAVFCGDAIHSPIQVLHPGWSAGLDTDRNRSRLTRLSLLQSLAENHGWLVPAHFRGTHRARIRAVGEGFFPDFAPP
ncbi:MAG: MBL fold metallo-hydrolase [Pseudomonadota bacterium]|nr:MBL fold metallo-hydrolase [Pseudomonadota bacterium]